MLARIYRSAVGCGHPFINIFDPFKSFRCDKTAAGILIVGGMTLFGDRYPIMRVAVLVGSVVVFIAIMTGVIPKTVPPLILLSAVLPCVVLVYSRPLYSNEDTESADDMEEAIW